MRRIWVSAAAVVASVSVAGWMAASFAEERKPGAALPPPSLFDDSPNQVRAVDAPAGLSSSAVVQAKPASSASVKAAANLPPPENFEEEQAPKVVWWKPWTWFSGNSRKADKPAEMAASVEATPAAKVTPSATAAMSASTEDDSSTRAGYAYDNPARKIRSGFGDCVKTGLWESDGKTDACGNPVGASAQSQVSVLEQPAAVAERPVDATSPAQASAQGSTPTAASAPKSTAVVPVAPASQPEPVVVSPLAPDQDDQRKALGEKDAFDSVRVNAAAPAPDAGDLSAASIAATRAKKEARGDASADGGANVNVSADAPAKGAKRLVDDKPLSMSAEALFGFKSAKLLYGGKKQLDEFAKKLADDDYQSVRVVGHTDRIGTPERNKKLSVRRAKAVKDYLVMKGIEPSRILVDGRGAQDPVTEPRQCEGLPMTARRACMSPDRRVEIVVTRAFAKKKPEAMPAAGEPRS